MIHVLLAPMLKPPASWLDHIVHLLPGRRAVLQHTRHNPWMQAALKGISLRRMTCRIKPPLAADLSFWEPSCLRKQRDYKLD